MTDLSILFPFPTSAAERDLLIAADDVGGSGEVLPFALFEAAADLSIYFEDDAAEYAALRVVAARIDPCFRASPEMACRPQLRVVLQPIEDQQGLFAVDAALHVFYELEDAELTGLLGAVTRAQSAEDAAGPLRVHPAMAREGLEGDAAQTVRSAMLAVMGVERLSRMTFMQLGGQANVWIFGGFDRVDGQMIPLSIVGSGATTQTFDNNAVPDLQDFHGGVEPILQPDDLSLFYESDTARNLSDDDLWPAYESALRVQNPTVHTSESVSCVACHTANAAIEWAHRNTDLASRPSPARFENDVDLTPPSSVFGEESRTVRAFGYQDTTPAVSNRTIFETAMLVAHFRAIYGP